MAQSLDTNNYNDVILEDFAIYDFFLNMTRDKIELNIDLKDLINVLEFKIQSKKAFTYILKD